MYHIFRVWGYQSRVGNSLNTYDTYEKTAKSGFLFQNTKGGFEPVNPFWFQETKSFIRVYRYFNMRAPIVGRKFEVGDIEAPDREKIKGIKVASMSG